MEKQIKKAIELAKKTGDKIIVFDSPESQNATVIMNLNDYEALVFKKSGKKELTEERIIDKINRDVAQWKNGEESGFLGHYLEDENSEFDDYSEEDQELDFNDNDDNQPKGKRNNWNIPQERKMGADNTGDDLEEDTHYLEEVPF